MTGTLPAAGDEIAATVTTVAPFGLLVVTDSGVPGLARDARADAGSTVRVRVTEYDAAERRFSADPA
ncbi:hypothetical protein [Jiangella mangrovi]|uniref:Ribosomal protein S1 n=1 Tax=Jiangella mangrovi TaxID=1524084 RepID=A0A7W9GSH7_9ACTN|nr:hypothetical protein [Jiangella mangrovi]MBB5788934.1 ribosomal protein S1 [Jiangella mangrovi]